MKLDIEQLRREQNERYKEADKEGKADISSAIDKKSFNAPTGRLRKLEDVHPSESNLAEDDDTDEIIATFDGRKTRFHN